MHHASNAAALRVTDRTSCESSENKCPVFVRRDIRVVRTWIRHVHASGGSGSCPLNPPWSARWPWDSKCRLLKARTGSNTSAKTPRVPRCTSHYRPFFIHGIDYTSPPTADWHITAHMQAVGCPRDRAEEKVKERRKRGRDGRTEASKTIHLFRKTYRAPLKKD